MGQNSPKQLGQNLSKKEIVIEPTVCCWVPEVAGCVWKRFIRSLLGWTDAASAGDQEEVD